VRFRNTLVCPTLRYYWLPPQLLCTPHPEGTPVVHLFCWAG
jgi:hypothetical protein